MTGHEQVQNPTFLTTLQATLDILDDASSVMEENTYLTLTNNLQQLYNIYNSSTRTVPTIILPTTTLPTSTLPTSILPTTTLPTITSPRSNNDYSNADYRTIDTYITRSRTVIRRNYDVSGNYNATNSNTTNSNTNTTTNTTTNAVTNANTNATNTTNAVTNTTNNNDYNENNHLLNPENPIMSYSSLYGNASDYWNQAHFQNTRNTISVNAN